MSATIQFQVPAPAAGEVMPTAVVWYDSADGAVFS